MIASPWSRRKVGRVRLDRFTDKKKKTGNLSRSTEADATKRNAFKAVNKICVLTKHFHSYSVLLSMQNNLEQKCD